MTGWDKLGIRPGKILLPKGEYLNRLWPVVACDQYTSQPEVWEAVDREIGNIPSTLRLIVPEAFLAETRERSLAAAQAMSEYLKQDLFTALLDSFILVERRTQSGARLGLVALVDLEAYDYRPGSQSLIRATEETVLDRLPPRLQLREQAALELSHVMLLLDDPADSLLGPLYLARQSLPLVYDLPLLMAGGQIRGWRVAPGEASARVAEALGALLDRLSPGAPLFAVGDGNHSLAAAKAFWEAQKAGLTRAEQARHPARFALAELVNLRSPALLFEPIHRMAFGVGQEAVLEVLAPLGPVHQAEGFDIVLIGDKGDLPLALKNTGGQLITEALQRRLDEAALPLDYVHGEEALRQIAAQRGGTGILMPDFPKDQLFPVVRQYGRLPRKTFSMGEANEKRFYLEARRIRQAL